MATGRAARALTLGLLAGLLACDRRPAPAADTPAGPDRAVIAALEERLLRATRTADTAALAALWAPEYLSTSAVGHTSSRADALLAYGAGLVRVDSAVIADLDVRGYGHTAVALGLLRWRGSAAGGPFAQTARFQHVWAHQPDGAWRLVASQMTAQPEGTGRSRP